MFPKKQIAFFYQDNIERHNWEPLVHEAIRRGYEVLLTDNLNTSVEIGFYCSHENHPQFARFSVIMLHGMDQGRCRWPNMWIKEPWNKYDLGLLPGPSWVERWQECTTDPFVHPRKGVFQAGWPKADLIFNPVYNFWDKVKHLKTDLNLPYEKTILYAPSFETDNKQNDVVKCLGKQRMNILIKHWITEDERDVYEDIWNNIAIANEEHLKSGHHIQILDPRLSIMYCLGLCDLLVTDESSVAYEALLFDLPTVSVSDWVMRINNSSSSRPVRPPKEIVFLTNRNNLANKINDLISSPDIKNEISSKKDFYYSWLGESAKRVMDILEDQIEGFGLVSQITPIYKPNKNLIVKRKLLFRIRKLLQSYAPPLLKWLAKFKMTFKAIRKLGI